MSGDGRDVLVIGGGPAGLATAIALAKRGLAATVADADQAPVAKPCGEGLLPASLQALRDLGIEIAPGEGCALRGIRFLDEEICAEAEFRGPSGLGISRGSLHGLLVWEAEKQGIELLWRTRVTGLDARGVCVSDGAPIRARWIIGADGANSQVRRWMGISPAAARFAPGRGGRRIGFRQHYAVAPWSDFVEVYWGRGIQAYVTPTGGREVCVATVSRDPRLRVEDAVRQFPALADRLLGAKANGRERGAITQTLRLPRVTGERLALVGDASGCVDAITGCGLGLAFRQALALADALVRGDLGLYEAAHRSLMRRARLTSRTLLLLAARPHPRRIVFRVFERWPGIFERLLHGHAGFDSAAPVAPARDCDAPVFGGSSRLRTPGYLLER